MKPHLSGKANGRFVHGHASSRSPTYQTWRSMVKRCRYPSNANYAYYGGRGIRVCDEWLSFEGFLRDMGERPKGKTLDRIDVNEGYNPWNCRWATRTEQQAHRRGTKRIDRPGSKGPVPSKITERTEP